MKPEACRTCAWAQWEWSELRTTCQHGSYGVQRRRAPTYSITRGIPLRVAYRACRGHGRLAVQSLWARVRSILKGEAQ